MKPETIEAILKKYGLAPARIHEPQKGYRNQSFAVTLINGTMVNLIVYKNEAGILEKIHNAHRVALYCAQGFPVRRTHDDRVMELVIGEQKRYAAIYNYLPGITIPWEGYTRKHIKLLGKTMSDMHAVLVNTQLSSTSVIEEYQAIVTRMERYFNDKKVIEAMAKKLGISVHVNFPYVKELLNLCAQLPQQTLHMDFVRGNILFDGKGEEVHVSGILDFEKTAIGPKYFDIARTVAFLLVDCKYIEENKVRKYFIYSGYEKRGKSSLAKPFDFAPPLAPLRSPGQANSAERRKLTVSGAQLLEHLIELFLIYDFYKFLRHNPYEFLEQNEHFVRTIRQLQKRQRLSVHKA